MAKFDVFVGREEELALIDEWVARWETVHAVAVQGDGGVGKTWLLLEVLRRYRDRDDVAVVYFDSAEHPFSLQYQAMFLVQHLNPVSFPGFLEEMEKLEAGLEQQRHLKESMELEVLDLKDRLNRLQGKFQKPKQKKKGKKPSKKN